MRVLFILPESTMIERIGIMYLSAALKDRDYEVLLVFADRLGLKGLDKLMKNYKPEIVAYSAMTGEHLKLIEINQVLKAKYEYLAVFGGPHATFFPQLIEEEGCDALCVGEGDIIFPEFCHRLEQKEAYWETPNFVVKYKGSIFRNPLSPLIENLDELPFPDREIMYQASPKLVEDGTKMFFATRGCPYLCTYCFNRKYNEIFCGKGPILRHRSPDNLIEEICQVKTRYPMNKVVIGDDSFLLKPDGWINRFCELYKEKIGLQFGCSFRANHVTEEKIACLKKVGLDSVWMGVECGDENVSNEILNRRLTNQQILKTAEIIKNQGVKLVTQNIVGLLVEDSYNTDLKTLDFNLTIAPTFALSSLLFPYPGTKIQTYAREHGYLSDTEITLLETNKRSSILRFSSDEEKHKIENLHKLFGLIVRFPFLRKYCGFLCSLPLTGIYTFLFYLWYGYCVKIKLSPISTLRKNIFEYIALFFRMISKT